MGEAKRRRQAGENKQRTPSEKSWKCQIVLSYEHEPYLIIDADQELLEHARAVEKPTTNSEDAARQWLTANFSYLREEVALIRDFNQLEKRKEIVTKAIILVQFLLASRQAYLSDGYGAVVLNLLARQARGDPALPGYEVSVLSKPLTVAEIRARSTAKHLYVDNGDGIVKNLDLPKEPTNVRYKDRSCIAISAFWRNETPGGIMYKIKTTDQPDLDDFMEILDEKILELANTRPLAKDIEEYLSYWAQQTERDDDTCFEIIARIAYAEEARYFQSDEFNGMVYIYKVGKDGIHVDRKDLDLK